MMKKVYFMAVAGNSNSGVKDDRKDAEAWAAKTLQNNSINTVHICEVIAVAERASPPIQFRDPGPPVSEVAKAA